MALIITFMLFIPPFFGKADDGSFYKVLEGNGLYSLFPGAGSFLVSYGIASGEGSNILLSLAKWLGGHGGVMDIRVLGLIYSALFITGAGFMIAALDKRHKVAYFACAAMAVVMFTDIGYISLFNSFYTDALPLAALSLVFGAFLYIASREKPNVLSVIVYLLGTLLLFYAGGVSKIAAFLAALFTVRFFGVRRDALFKTVVSLALAVSLVFGFLGISLPSYTDERIDLYSSVFYGILLDSPTPEADLKALSIPEEYAVLAGVDYYEADKTVDVDGEKFKADFYDNISYAKIAKFYITHPVRHYRALDKTAQNIAYIKQGYITNKAQHEADYRFKPEMAIWSNVRRIILPTFFGIILVILLLVCFFGARGIKKERVGFGEAAIFAVLCAGMYFGAPFIKSGFTSISRNLIPFNFLFDIILIIVAAWAIETIIRRRKNLKDMYGVTQ